MQEKLQISLRNSLTFSTSLNPADRRATGATPPGIPRSSQARRNSSTAKASKRDPPTLYTTPNKNRATIYAPHFTDRKRAVSLSLRRESELTPQPTPRISAAAPVSNSGRRSLCVRTRYVSDSACACL